MTIFWDLEGVIEIELSLLVAEKGDSGGEAIEDALETGTVLVGES